jgi:beta-lactamase class A
MANLLNLQNQFKTLEKFCNGTLGVSARHIENDNEINFNADQRFLMCSTYKVAIAVYLLMGLLPYRTPVAHKTGSLTGYTCDIGIITLPHDAGNVAVSAFIKESDKDLANNERVLAEVGRSVYDFYLFN